MALVTLSAQPARIECANGAGCVRKRVRRGWELVIESSDGRHVGSYSGRRRRPGGTVPLTNGTQLAVRPRLPGAWKLEPIDTQAQIADMRGHSSLATALTIRSLPIGVAEAHVAILTACAVTMLARMLRTPGGGGY